MNTFNSCERLRCLGGITVTAFWIKFIGWTLLLGGWDQCHLPCWALVDRHLWPLTCQSCMWKAHWFDCFPSDTQSITVRNWFCTSLQYPMAYREFLIEVTLSTAADWLLQSPLTAVQWALTTSQLSHTLAPLVPWSPQPPPFSNAQYTCTAPLALTFNMSKLNSLVFSPLPLLPCFALFARAAAVRRRPKRLCKQTRRGFGSAAVTLCLLTRAAPVVPADGRMWKLLQGRKQWSSNFRRLEVCFQIIQMKGRIKKSPPSFHCLYWCYIVVVPAMKQCFDTWNYYFYGFLLELVLHLAKETTQLEVRPKQCHTMKSEPS